MSLKKLDEVEVIKQKSTTDGRSKIYFYDQRKAGNNFCSKVTFGENYILCKRNDFLELWFLVDDFVVVFAVVVMVVVSIPTILRLNGNEDFSWLG